MRNKVADVPRLEGMQEQQPQAATHADLLQNFTIDPFSGAWDSRIGYERFFSSTSSGFDPWATTKRIDSIYYWAKRNGALDQILFESEGVIKLLVDWNGGAYSTVTLITANG